MLNHVCTHLKELLDAERPELKKEIERNKYYLSQKAYCDVGWEEAEKDFIEYYLRTWTAGFKAAYCNYCCPDAEDCNLKEEGNGC